MKYILLRLKYSLYFLITIDARTRYLAGENRGCYISKIEHDTFGSTITKHPNIKNKREYITWKEFKKLHNN